MTDPDVQYRPLGYDGPHYYVLSVPKQQMGAYTANQLMSAAGCLDIVGSHKYWDDYWGEGPERKRRINWQEAGANIMKQCLDAGLFDPSRVRGRGVWLDRDRVVLHLGDRHNAPADTDYIYQMRPAWVPGYTGAHGPVTPILEACVQLPWAHPMHAELLAGWIALAPVCGALAHRPHLRIEGDAAPVLEVVRACLGAMVAAEPREDARPIITERWLGSPGACMVLGTGKLADATVLTLRDEPAICPALPPETPTALLARQVAYLDALRHNTATFRAIRPGDIGTLMAGAWSLYSTEVMSAQVARVFLGRYTNAA